MKKSVKIISAVLIVIALLISLNSTVLASSQTTQRTGMEGVIQNIAAGDSTVSTGKIQEMGASIVTIMQTVGIVVAVVILLILGIKYMMGSAEEKAEYKKTMIPYVVGAILIFASTTIVNIVYQLANSLN